MFYGDRGDAAALIYFWIAKAETTSLDTLARMYEPGPKPYLAGLRYAERREGLQAADTAFPRDDVFTGTFGSEQIFLRCDPPALVPETGPRARPVCRYQGQLGASDLAFGYRFDRSELDRWADIHARLKARLLSFLSLNTDV